jgi:hypothetical protein
VEGDEGDVVKLILAIVGLSAAAVALLVPGVSLYFESGKGARCASCHEMREPLAQWSGSSHRDTACGKCHGDALTLDPSFHRTNLTRAVAHLRGEVPEQIVLGNRFVEKMSGQCAGCHRQEHAAWSSGPHSASYARIFADAKHNTKNMLMDDCLRCHGMFYEGGVAELVTPIDRKGPWKMRRADLAATPSMPCLACHAVHTPGAPMKKAGAEGRIDGPRQEVTRPSLAFYDRRTQRHIPIAELALPVMQEGARPVKMSPDPRQALCYQCHAPIASMQVGSGDDRTATGVHEGVSCLACHAQHGQKTRASCASCHPKMSNCGLDVEKMDTTFRSAESKHNIHWVKCVDCHTKGVPPKKVARLESKK